MLIIWLSKFFLMIYPWVIFPIVCFLSVFHSGIKKRLDFETKNFDTANGFSFHRQGIAADFFFEVSSEGELEAVKPLIELCLKSKKYVELVYCSPSVENGCLKLQTEYPHHLRTLRLPLLTFHLNQGSTSLRNWSNASKIILCRYDFFPELLVLGKMPGRTFYLFSASFKSRRYLLKKTYSFRRDLWKSLYSLFQVIICPTTRDISDFVKLGIPSGKCVELELRILQIVKRQEQAWLTLHRLPYFEQLKMNLESFPKDQRIVIASCWPHEMEIFLDKNFQQHILNRKVSVVLVPHKLDKTSLNEIATMFIRNCENKIPLYQVGYHQSYETNYQNISNFKLSAGVLLMAEKGVLCEFFTFFGSAMVGGGHGKSVHSLLEPFLGGCQVYCGPKIHRSSEYDLIEGQLPSAITIVEKVETFYQLHQNLKSKFASGDKVQKLVQNTLERKSTVIRLLGL